MAALASLSRLFNLFGNNCLRRTDLNILLKPCQPSPFRLWEVSTTGIYTRLPWMPEIPKHQEIVQENNFAKEKLANDVVKEINDQIANDRVGRLFAVVQVCGKQFKVTETDTIVTEGRWPPQPGDQLKLEKVLLVGSTDFSLIGRPILHQDLVSVNATVIEKTVSHTKFTFRFKPRKRYHRLKLYRIHRTVLRINSINIKGNILKKEEVEGLDRIY